MPPPGRLRRCKDSGLARRNGGNRLVKNDLDTIVISALIVARNIGLAVAGFTVQRTGCR